MKPTYASIASVLLVAACSSNGGSPSSPTADGGASLTISPSTANVATCRTKTFTATPGDGVQWSVVGEGTVNAGTYTAPRRVPSPATAKVQATREGQTASAEVSLATAFPESPIDVGRGVSGGDAVHGLAANGDTVYGLVLTRSEVKVAKSTDGGQSWTAKSSVATTDPEYAPMASIAVDPADPNTVYVAVHYVKDNSGFLSLFVSVDGGGVWKEQPLYRGGTSETHLPDVAAPSPNHVVVAAAASWQDGNGGQGSLVLDWHDDARGSNLKPLDAFDNGYNALASKPSNSIKLSTVHESSGGRYGVQLATAKGRVCQVYASVSLSVDAKSFFGTCSTDDGKTFDEPKVLLAGKASLMERPRLALSPDGSLAVLGYTAHESATDGGEARYAVAKASGFAFGETKKLPAWKEGDEQLSSSDLEVYVDSSKVIWFGRDVGNGKVAFDKSCDEGETLSGAFQVGITDFHRRALLLETSKGLYAGATSGPFDGVAPSGLTLVRVLTPAN